MHPLLGAPLWPAGHLPYEGGDWLSPLLSPTFNAARKMKRAKLLISPRVGEMAGRPEGGAIEQDLACFMDQPHERALRTLRDT
jgi:hypothetical protein